MPARVRGSAVLTALAAGSLSLLLSGLLTLLVGVSPLSTYREIWNGALGSPDALGKTITVALPFAFVALGFSLAFRCGLYNVGLEGQLYMGAIGATLVATKLELPGGMHLVAAVVAGALGGAIWASLPGVLKLWRGVNEIISSLFLNYVAILLTGWVLASPLKDPSSIYPQSASIPSSAELPQISGTRIGAGVLLAIVCACGVSWLLSRTVLGFEMRTVGANPRVARYAGMRVDRVVMGAFLVSGALGGLAGTVELLGNQHVLLEQFSPGWGYTGIAASLLGGATAVGSMAAAGFFGVLSNGSTQLQLHLGVPATFALIVQGVAVVLVLAAMALRQRPLPKRESRPPPVSGRARRNEGRHDVAEEAAG